jgi:NADH dehydrogenase
VVIIGGGFGGLTVARALADAPVRVTLFDRSNHHLFQPLLYQVAMAGLSPAEIAVPIRSLLREATNVNVLLDEVLSIDLAKKSLALHSKETVTFDYVIIAAGARTSWFGHDVWSEHALGLKDLDDAVEIRRRTLVAFEAAERERDLEKRRALMTFVVIGGGPTGVELAGALSELSSHVLSRDFRNIDPRATKVILLEAGPAILNSFDPALQQKAVAQLVDLGVEVRTGAKVTNIDARGVELGAERIACSTVIWAAGVRAAPITEKLGVPLDRAGRIVVEKDCSLPGHPDSFAIGDIAAFTGEDGKPLPGVSPVAMQQARLVAKNILRSLHKEPRETFRYVDKGTMATIGRSRAIAQVGSLQLSGFKAWLTWLLIHIWYLIGFKNRIFVLMSWAWSYFTYKRGARLITGGLLDPSSRRRRSTTEEKLREANPKPEANVHR